MTMSSLAKKLLIKQGHRIAVLNPPLKYVEDLRPLPDGAECPSALAGQYDFVHLFAGNKAELEKLLPQALGALKKDGLFWVSYPKQSSKVKTDLNRDILWKLVGKHGFDGVSLISINDVWSAMRFRAHEAVGKNKKD
jgi:hypothetical protein